MPTEPTSVISCILLPGGLDLEVKVWWLMCPYLSQRAWGGNGERIRPASSALAILYYRVYLYMTFLPLFPVPRKAQLFYQDILIEFGTYS